MNELLIAIILTFGILTFFILREEFSYHYNKDRTVRKHKKTKKVEQLTTNGWE